MSTLSEGRRRAIEQSGWGEKFRLVQPHNLAFWVYCLLVVVGADVISGQVSIAAAAYSGALISGIIAFGLLAVAYLWFIHYEDRYTTVPPKLAVAGFVWGGVAEDFVGVTRDGSVVAFVFRPPGQSTSSLGQAVGEGVEIVVSGPSDAMSHRRNDIVSMIRSIREAS